MKITAQMHFAKALQQLRKSGVEPGDMTPDELYALAEAARRCADPFREVNADAAGFPVRVCEGVYFWKLTIGASVWLDEVTEMLGGGTSPRYRLAMIHALVHSREPEAFAGLDTERKVMRAVRATMRTIHATPEEVNRAIDVALGLRRPLTGRLSAPAWRLRRASRRGNGYGTAAEPTRSWPTTTSTSSRAPTRAASPPGAWQTSSTTP